MLLKDYYNILQLPAQATLPEIKQAYRRLAMIYHPDRNVNDPYAEAQFREIQEAYEVLTNPIKREGWLQQRWYNQSIGKKKTAEVITPVSILKLSLELERYVWRLDINRMNKEGLFHYISELISADTVDKLKQFNDEGINRQIVTTLLTAMKPLPIKFITQLSHNLTALAAEDQTSVQRINAFVNQQKKLFLWERYKVAVIIVLTLLICALILFTTK